MSHGGAIGIMELVHQPFLLGGGGMSSADVFGLQVLHLAGCGWCSSLSSHHFPCYSQATGEDEKEMLYNFTPGRDHYPKI